MPFGDIPPSGYKPLKLKPETEAAWACGDWAVAGSVKIDVPFELRWRDRQWRLKPCGACADCCSRLPAQCEAWADPVYVVTQQIPEWYAPERR